MKKLLKFAVCLALLVMVMVLFTGCKVTGGGWFIDGYYGDNGNDNGNGSGSMSVRGGNEETKCTFGFNAQGTEIDKRWKFKGQFQFKEHKKGGMKIHIDDMVLLLDFDSVVLFGGTDKEGEVGVAVAVTDMGEPGPGAGDAIAIWYDLDVSSLFDPPSWVPDWGGVIQGGNIQVH